MRSGSPAEGSASFSGSFATGAQDCKLHSPTSTQDIPSSLQSRDKHLFIEKGVVAQEFLSLLLDRSLSRLESYFIAFMLSIFLEHYSIFK